MARLALLAGSNGPSSAKLDTLQFVHSDVDRLAAALSTSPAGYDNVEIVEKGKSAKDALAQFESLASRSKYGDVLFFYFSGHGHVLRQQLFLIWEDTDLTRPVTTALPISQLKTVFANARAQARLMVLDCCRSGAAGELVFAKGHEDGMAEPLIEAAREGASAIITACSKNAITRELPELKSGYLTHLLVSALSDRIHEADRDKDGLLSLNDFLGYCAEETQTFNRRNTLPEPLEYPELYGEIRGDVYLTVHRVLRSDCLKAEPSQVEILESIKRILRIFDLSDAEKLQEARVDRFQRFLGDLLSKAGQQFNQYKSLAYEYASVLLLPDQIIEAEFKAYSAKIKAASTDGPLIPPRHLGKRTTVFFVSLSVSEVSHKSIDLQCGLFTNFLLQALEGLGADNLGMVTANSAYEYILRQMRSDAWNTQAPHLDVIGDSEVVLTGSGIDFKRLNRKRLALLVGTNTFSAPTIPALNNSEGYVRSIADALSKMGGFECRLLIGSDATTHNVQYAIRQLIGGCSEEDMFLFYFCGRGDLNATGEPHLIFYDGEGTERCNGVPVKEIASYLKEAAVGQFVFILDSCFSSKPIYAFQ